MPERFPICLSGLTAAAFGAGLAGMAGCLPGTNDAGHGWSMDKHVYKSVVWQPKTVSLTDTASGETLWTKEVPVGKQIVIEFHANDAAGDDPRRPDQMAWDIVDINKGADGWEGRIDVPGSNWRRLSFDLRPAPEYPRREAPVMEPPPLTAPAGAGAGEGSGAR